MSTDGVKGKTETERERERDTVFADNPSLSYSHFDITAPVKTFTLALITVCTKSSTHHTQNLFLSPKSQRSAEIVLLKG